MSGHRTAARGRPGARAAPITIPLSPRAMWRLLLAAAAAAAVAAAVLWALFVRLPERAVLGLANAGARAGLVVRKVDIAGARHQPKLSIYRETLSGGSDSMLLLDLPATRERLLVLPWVQDASIARRWPDRLEVTIVERRPAAIWQHHGRLHLIDRRGGILPSDRLDQFPDLPLLIGPGAEDQVVPLLALLATEPDIARHLKAATWVGNRRWDLKMATGETLSLPEGPAARGALRRFAGIERETPLLGRGFQRFDMRIADRLVVRVASETGTARPHAPAASSPQPGLPGRSMAPAMAGAVAPVGAAPAGPEVRI